MVSGESYRVSVVKIFESGSKRARNRARPCVECEIAPNNDPTQEAGRAEARSFDAGGRRPFAELIAVRPNEFEQRREAAVSLQQPAAGIRSE